MNTNNTNHRTEEEYPPSEAVMETYLPPSEDHTTQIAGPSRRINTGTEPDMPSTPPSSPTSSSEGSTSPTSTTTSEDSDDTSEPSTPNQVHPITLDTLDTDFDAKVVDICDLVRTCTYEHVHTFSRHAVHKMQAHHSALQDELHRKLASQEAQFEMRLEERRAEEVRVRRDLEAQVVAEKERAAGLAAAREEERGELVKSRALVRELKMLRRLERSGRERRKEDYAEAREELRRCRKSRFWYRAVVLTNWVALGYMMASYLSIDYFRFGFLGYLSTLVSIMFRGSTLHVSPVQFSEVEFTMGRKNAFQPRAIYCAGAPTSIWPHEDPQSETAEPDNFMTNATDTDQRTTSPAAANPEGLDQSPAKREDFDGVVGNAYKNINAQMEDTHRQVLAIIQQERQTLEDEFRQQLASQKAQFEAALAEGAKIQQFLEERVEEEKTKAAEAISSRDDAQKLLVERCFQVTHLKREMQLKETAAVTKIKAYIVACAQLKKAVQG
ncbi:hypothetical protein DENSPDRAFT_851029 [Dentipellis sp. KUC8613]|nr:hypothetical protein DENSPDRAFT_851029 [Dentipellis sp. KUC8613]